jgi:hypothetical protein
LGDWILKSAHHGSLLSYDRQMKAELAESKPSFFCRRSKQGLAHGTTILNSVGITSCEILTVLNFKFWVLLPVCCRSNSHEEIDLWYSDNIGE